MWANGVKGAGNVTENFRTFSWCLPEHYLGHLEFSNLITEMNTDKQWSTAKVHTSFFTVMFINPKNQLIKATHFLPTVCFSHIHHSFMSRTSCNTRLPQLKIVKKQKFEILKGSVKKKLSLNMSEALGLDWAAHWGAHFCCLIYSCVTLKLSEEGNPEASSQW